jgi:hypothetical protein
MMKGRIRLEHMVLLAAEFGSVERRRFGQRLSASSFAACANEIISRDQT